LKYGAKKLQQKKVRAEIPTLAAAIKVTSVYHFTQVVDGFG
jgi:hypothetical protein